MSKTGKRGDCGGPHEALNVPMRDVSESNPNSSLSKTSGPKRHPRPEILEKLCTESMAVGECFYYCSKEEGHKGKHYNEYYGGFW